MPYSGGVSTVSTSSMSHSMSSLKSQFMETDAWSSFLSEGLYDEDSSGSGDFSPSQTLPDSASDGETNTRKIRRKHLVHKVRLSRNIFSDHLLVPGGGETRGQHEGEEEDAEHQRRLRESSPAHPHPSVREETQQSGHFETYHRVNI